MISYALDRSDRVVRVSEGWNSFAQENNGAGAAQSAIIDLPIWQFVEGDDTRSLINALFFTVRRRGVPLKLLNRCDAPGRLQQTKMTVAPLPSQGLFISHVPIARSVLTTQTLIGDVTLDGPAEAKCSVCCAHRLGSTWFDPFDFKTEYQPPTRYEVCPACKRRAQKAIEAAERGDTPAEAWHANSSFAPGALREIRS